MESLYYSEMGCSNRWQQYLKKYLSSDKSLRILYTSMTCKDTPNVFFLFDNKDRCDAVYVHHIDTDFQKLNCDFVFDYDVILRHFSNYSSCSSSEQEKILSIRNNELENIKKIASYISEREERRVSFGFVYFAFDFERNYAYDHKYMFYSINSGSSFIEEEVDMSDTSFHDSDFMGKIIYIHNCLVKQDKGKSFIKAQGIM